MLCWISLPQLSENGDYLQNNMEIELEYGSTVIWHSCMRDLQRGSESDSDLEHEGAVDGDMFDMGATQMQF
jgi:hypothetical protein